MKRTLAWVLIIVGCLTWAALVEARTIRVTTLQDTFAIDGQCSLREALNAANGANYVDDACGLGDPGMDVIELPSGTYSLHTAYLGEDESWGDLDVRSEVVFDAHLGNVIIRQELDIHQQVNGRVLDVWVSGRATLKNLTIEGGVETLGGGGIKNWGWLLLENVTVTGNTAAYGGGGIETHPGSTTFIYDSTISGNTSTRTDNQGGGGGILVTGGNVYLDGSTVSGNVSRWNGGGIMAKSGGLVDLVNSTISGNGSFIHGGGIYNAGANISLSNVTVTANTANSDLSSDNDGYAGGVMNSSGIVNLWNSLIAGNVRGYGGGIMLFIPDCAGTLTSQGYNLVGVKSDACTIIDAGPGGDQIGSAVQIDAKLGPLADNNGPTLTHALNEGSPAIDAGNPLGCRAAGGGYVSKDQRGRIRPSGLVCDIGAYEYSYIASRYVVTSTADDGTGCTLREALESIMSGNPADGCSDAGSTGVDRIEFDPAVTGTISLNAELPIVRQSIDIVGPGSAILAINGQGLYRSGFLIDSPGNSATVALSGLTLTGGYNLNQGATLLVYDGEALELNDVVIDNSGCNDYCAIVQASGFVIIKDSTISNSTGEGLSVYNGSLEIVNTVISNSTSSGLRIENSSVQMVDTSLIGNGSAISTGGGAQIRNTSMTATGCTVTNNTGGGFYIENAGGQSVVIEKCSFSSNTADGGGAILIDTGMVSIRDSVIHGNRAVATNGGSGGGIAVSGSGTTLTIANTTISGNSAFGYGGGLSQDTPGGVVRLANVTITDNTADDTASGNYLAGGIYIASGSLRLRNSIIAGNRSLNPTDNVPEISGCTRITSEDYNLLGDVSLYCTPAPWAAHDITGADPHLGPLGNYGGPTKTHYLLIGSAAIDGADPIDGCSWDHDSDPGTPDIPLNADQRAWARYVDGNADELNICDIGAFEYDGTIFSDIIFENGFE